MFEKMKLTAFHNVRIEASNTVDREGIIIPKPLLAISDLEEFEQVIVTKINSDSYNNRVRTIVLADDNIEQVTVCGSLAKYLLKGDLTCIISETFVSKEDKRKYREGKWAIIDIGFDAQSNMDNKNYTIELQYYDSKKKVMDNTNDLCDAIEKRKHLNRIKMFAIIKGLKINKTHSDCLHGSAEIPGSLLSNAGIEQYTSVSVYNTSVGGVAETYAVAMPEGVVMTTGAMATFAKLGEVVNVAAFCLTNKRIFPKVCHTDGDKIIRKEE